MLTNVKKVLGPKVGLATLTLKKHSPEILLAGGVTMGIASVVMIAKAHKKSEEVFNDVIMDIEDAHDYIKDVKGKEDQEVGDLTLSKKEEAKLLLPLYREGFKRAVILYGPGTLMGVGGLALILASHGILRKRNRGLIATVAVLTRGFAEYRKRVILELGEDADERFYYGAEARNVTTMEVGPDGKKKKHKSTKNHLPEELSPIIYQKVFDRMNPNWRDVEEMNLWYLKMTEKYMTDKLNLNGYVMLNDVYRALAMAESPEGAVVGWSLNIPGDNHISFGLEKPINMREGDERYILDFNVNGVVFEHIGE